MASWIDYANFAVASGGLVTALLGFILTMSIPFMGRWERTWFGLLFLFQLAYVSSDLVSQVALTLLGDGFALLSQVSVFCESFFSSLLAPMITVYLLRCAGKDWRRDKLFQVVCILWAAYTSLLVVTQMTRVIYYITPDNVYHRGPLYPLLLVPPVLIMGINLALLCRHWSRLTKRQRLGFTVSLLVPFVCMLVQMVVYGLLAIVFGTGVSALVMFSLVLSDQVDAHIRGHEEVLQRRAHVMALQMRPHFIYNVMTSIYYLCVQDPERAQQVTLDFTNYLRANFSAVTERDMVPFSKELEHTRAYLSVEQARFDDRLQFEVDCPHTSFDVPPLTLQPLVENSVKHGMDPERGPLHIRVTSRHEGGHSVITVADDGAGFDPAIIANGGAPALANITERLTSMGASVTIDSEEGPSDSGTVVEIRVPDTDE